MFKVCPKIANVLLKFSNPPPCFLSPPGENPGNENLIVTIYYELLQIVLHSPTKKQGLKLGGVTPPYISNIA